MGSPAQSVKMQAHLSNLGQVLSKNPLQWGLWSRDALESPSISVLILTVLPFGISPCTVIGARPGKRHPQPDSSPLLFCGHRIFLFVRVIPHFSPLFIALLYFWTTLISLCLLWGGTSNAGQTVAVVVSLHGAFTDLSILHFFLCSTVKLVKSFPFFSSRMHIYWILSALLMYLCDTTQLSWPCLVYLQPLISLYRQPPETRQSWQGPFWPVVCSAENPSPFAFCSVPPPHLLH